MAGMTCDICQGTQVVNCMPVNYNAEEEAAKSLTAEVQKLQAGTAINTLGVIIT